MKFDNDIITFLTGVSKPIAVDQCSRVCLLYYLPTSICNIYVIN